MKSSRLSGIISLITLIVQLISYFTRVSEETKEREIEFESWDGRGGPHFKLRPFGWMNCNVTNMVSCAPRDNDTSPYWATRYPMVPDYDNDFDLELLEDLDDSEEAVLESPKTDLHRLYPSKSLAAPTAEDAPAAEDDFADTDNFDKAIETPGNHVSENLRKRHTSSPRGTVMGPFVRAMAVVVERMMLDAKYDYYLDLRDDPLESKVLGISLQIIIQTFNAIQLSEDAKNFTLSSGVKSQLDNALRDSMSSIAGLVSILGFLVGGSNLLEKKEWQDHPSELGSQEAGLGKQLLKNILSGLTKENKEVNISPVRILDPAFLHRMAISTENDLQQTPGISRNEIQAAEDNGSLKELEVDIENIRSSLKNMVGLGFSSGPEPAPSAPHEGTKLEDMSFVEFKKARKLESEAEMNPCSTRKLGKGSWYDPMGLYPDPRDPCYFAPAPVSESFKNYVPPVPESDPLGYSYPFYPYFGRKKRSIREDIKEWGSHTKRIGEEDRFDWNSNGNLTKPFIC
jgi:hypothetical protein